MLLSVPQETPVDDGDDALRAPSWTSHETQGSVHLFVLTLGIFLAPVMNIHEYWDDYMSRANPASILL